MLTRINQRMTEFSGRSVIFKEENIKSLQLHITSLD